MYLRQQKRQLDETKNLLTRFEQHAASGVVVNTGTGESGTVGPILVTPGHGAGSGTVGPRQATPGHGTASGTVGPRQATPGHGTASGTVGPILVTTGHGTASVQNMASVAGSRRVGESGAVGPVSIAHSHGTASVSCLAQKCVHGECVCHHPHVFTQVSTLDAHSRASRADLSATYEHCKYSLFYAIPYLPLPPPPNSTKNAGCA